MVNVERKYSKALMREAALFETILNTVGLTYDTTDEGIVLYDRKGNPYKDSNGDAMHFANSVDAVNSIDWLLEMNAVEYSCESDTIHIAADFNIDEDCANRFDTSERE